MAIRSDRMSLLNRLTAYLPNILKNCFELGALDRLSAEEAILAPAYRAGAHYTSPQFDYTDEALQHILDFLTDGGSDPVESFQLQILCQTLEDRVIAGRLRSVDVHDVGDPRSIYEHYYDNQINRIPDQADRLAARRFIEEGLIFEEEERRLSLYEGVIYKQYGIQPELLWQLVDSHLIRAEASITQSGYTYELSHDTLVAPVLKAKARRLAEERREADKQERQAREEELARERGKRRRATALAVAGFLLATLAAGASVFAISAQRVDEDSLHKFEREQTEKNRLRGQQLLTDAQTYLASGDTVLAVGKLHEALEIDSSKVVVKGMTQQLEQK